MGNKWENGLELYHLWAPLTGNTLHQFLEIYFINAFHCFLPYKRATIELGDVTPHNLRQLTRLNQVVFPVSYNDKFYKDILEAGELAKLGKQKSKKNKENDNDSFLCPTSLLQ